MKTLLKQRIIYTMQLSIGLALIIWILMQVDQKQFIAYFRELSLLNLLLIGLLSVLGLYIQFRRWKYLVERYSLHFELKDLLPSFFSGYAFRLLIPGGHAEFSKIYMLPGKKRGKVLAFSMEKLFQTLIKIFALIIVIPITFPGYTIHCIICLLILIVGYIFFPRIPVLKELQEKDVNYHRVFGMNLIFSIGIFLIMGLQYYLLLNQADIISLLATYHTSVYLWAAGMVPISVSGLGVREGLAVYFFKLYGISAAHAVATSLFLFTINTIFPAIIGAYYIYRKRAYFGELKDSIKSTREIIASIRNNKKSD